ncbi:hypothetical protein BDV97DRAFT_413068 [Delphinella strobiligena]|nr:hypothetical protein BDV97DRAFT_413068 [Delphinella strobiligena]
MYIEPQPLPVHRHLALPAVESATLWFHQSLETSNQASSSSHRGMERTAPPPFQDFVKRTPPVGAQKPLPPTPQTEQCTSTEFPTTRPRRTSSVYSRTISQWAPTPQSWRGQDIVASDMFLQPTMYSLSTPELILEEQPELQGVTTLLQPRTYAPLLASPSFLGTPLSEASIDVFAPSFEDHRDSMLLPAAERSALLSSQHFKTTSLDKPRITTLHTTRSLESLGTVKATQTPPPPLPFLSQTVARWRESGSANSGSTTTYFESSPTCSAYSPESTNDYSLVQPSTYDPSQMAEDSAIDMSADTPSRAAAAQPSSWTEPSFGKFRSRESKLSDKYFGVDPIDRAAMAPVARQQLPQDHRIAMGIALIRNQTPVEEDYEDRGRSRPSMTPPQSLKHSQHSRSHSTMDQRNEALMFEADRLAIEYHNLLPERDDEQARKTHRTSYHGRDVKLAPQPLFFNPRQVSKQRIEQYNRQRIGSILTFRPPGRRLERALPATRWRNKSPAPRPLLKLSTPDSTRSQSTSGSIPISSPMSIERRAETAETLRPQYRTKESLFPLVLTHVQNKQHFEQQVRQRSSIDDSNRFSSLYPRKDSYAVAYSLGLQNTVAADLPPIASPHGATIVATRAEAEAAFNRPSDIPIARPSKHKHNISDDSSTQRVVKKPLAQVGEKVASLTNVFHRSPYKNSTSGPSSLAPGTSDALHAQKTPKLIITSHGLPIISKPMPIIDSGMSSMTREPSLLAQTHKRPSLFAHFSDSRRESKAEKRRTELKKFYKTRPGYCDRESDTAKRNRWCFRVVVGPYLARNELIMNS